MSKQKVVTKPSMAPTISQENNGFLLAQFSALRDEILKRTEIQHQLVTLAVIASGAFLSVNLEGLLTVALAYPALAMFLAAAWSQNHVRILQIGRYINTGIEEKMLNDASGWESYMQRIRKKGVFGSLSLLASRGILVGTQLLTIGVSLLKTSFPKKDIALLILDSLIVLATILILKPRDIDKEEAKHLFDSD